MGPRWKLDRSIHLAYGPFPRDTSPSLQVLSWGSGPNPTTSSFCSIHHPTAPQGGHSHYPIVPMRKLWLRQRK